MCVSSWNRIGVLHHIVRVSCCAGACVQSRKVVSEKKLRTIKAVLNVDYDPEQEQEGSQHGTAQHHSRPAASDAFDEVRAR